MIPKVIKLNKLEIYIKKFKQFGALSIFILMFTTLVIGCASGPDPKLGEKTELQNLLNQMPEVPVAGKKLKFEFGGDAWVAKLNGKEYLAGTFTSEDSEEGSVLILEQTHVYSSEKNPLTGKEIKWVSTPGPQIVLEYKKGPPESLSIGQAQTASAKTGEAQSTAASSPAAQNGGDVSKNRQASANKDTKTETYPQFSIGFWLGKNMGSVLETDGADGFSYAALINLQLFKYFSVVTEVGLFGYTWFNYEGRTPLNWGTATETENSKYITATLYAGLPLTLLQNIKIDILAGMYLRTGKQEQRGVKPIFGLNAGVFSGPHYLFGLFRFGFDPIEPSVSP